MNLLSIFHPLKYTPRYLYSIVMTHEYRFRVDFKGMLYFDDQSDPSLNNIIKDKKFI